MIIMNNCDNKNYIRIYINLYVHYPEAFLETIINNQLLDYFKRYFNQTNLIIESDVKVNSLPHVEEEEINIEVDYKLDNMINEEVVLKDWKQYIKEFFKGKIKEVDIIIK